MDNYKIIGGDGREYGPATLEELHQWVTEGRVGPQTMVWDGRAETWGPASQIFELAQAFQQPGLKTPPATPVPVALAGFWVRLAAYLVDRIVLWMIFSFAWMAASKWLNIEQPSLESLNEIQDPAQFWEAALPLLARQMAVYLPIHLVYDVLFNGRFGATPGKMLVCVRIVRLDGSRISYGVALLRWLSARVSDLLLYTGYLLVAFRRDKRALHDLLASTQVIVRK